MPKLHRLIAAAFGLALPVVLATTAQAAPPRHHHPAHVRTATYKVVQHKAARPQRHASQSSRRLAQAQHRHSIMRGS